MSTAKYLEEGETIVNPPSSFKARVWEHCGFLGRTKDGTVLEDRSWSVCKICKMKIKYSGNTTNLSTHLSRKHSVMIERDKKTDETKHVKTQPTLLSMVSSSTRRTSTELNAKEKDEITRAVCEFIVKDLRPFKVVENTGFKHLLAVLEPRYKLPSRQFFSDRLIPEMYESVKKRVVAELGIAHGVGLTSDGWTSRSTESYETITCHFISQDWIIESRILQTRTLSESHTAQNLCENLKDAIEEWGLVDNVQGIVTDNAANMTLAVRMTGIPNIRCFAHSLNLASQKALTVPSISKLLGKVRKVVTFFHKSSTATAILKEKQVLLTLPCHKLKIDVQTRWNSSYDMIERYLEHQSAVQATFLCKEIRKKVAEFPALSDSDFVLAEDFIKIMEPMKLATVTMCEESVPTVSVVLPLLHQLKRNFQPNDDDSKAVVDLKQAIFKNLSLRYTPDVQDTDFLIKAAALDPRFKLLPFLDEADRHRIYGILEKEASLEKRCVEIKEEPDEPSNSPQLPIAPESLTDQTSTDQASTSSTQTKAEPDTKPSSPKKKKQSLADLFDDELYVVSETAPRSSLERASDEVTVYRKKASIRLNNSPLQWWKENEVSLPLLASLAKKYLAVPGNTVPSERVFSTAGDIVSGQRACLKSKHVDRLLFLKKNLQ
ncbi:E3 SUMO-protein ligase ZBED1-like [Ruditapes philippinarum]|uniref:E3 SUMO-protein ligase ZBED1-like n=1 Tax=Ruditapes philippinarum TaxID=129788 RepID=UPI00295B9AB0|nr:E3 SUMO-protein ligase ZBED1-like [Ruditapes philippinarum]